MTYQINVENIKCGGCATTIRSKLEAMDSIDKIDVDIGEGIVKVEAGEDTREAVTAKLLKLGYPESGTAEGIAAAKAKAKSFVSCAVGRISGED
ncbi:MAG: heavy-metal-associated domain-containing protein [Gammaproteobacteria bacterium]|nr:heavy-metal-associated domain-containing protein [Gammaproteobacteria bacterium]